MPENSESENSGLVHFPLGIGMKSGQVFELIAPIQFGFGELTTYKKPTGFIGITNERILIGSNAAIRPIKPSQELYVVELHRAYLMRRLLEAPSIRFVNVVHPQIQSGRPLYSCTNISDLRVYMIDLLDQYS